MLLRLVTISSQRNWRSSNNKQMGADKGEHMQRQDNRSLAHPLPHSSSNSSETRSRNSNSSSIRNHMLV